MHLTRHKFRIHMVYAMCSALMSPSITTRLVPYLLSRGLVYSSLRPGTAVLAYLSAARWCMPELCLLHPAPCFQHHEHSPSRLGIPFHSRPLRLLKSCNLKRKEIRANPGDLGSSPGYQYNISFSSQLSRSRIRKHP